MKTLISRFVNSLYITKSGTIVKQSRNKSKKIKDEIEYYKSIPKSFTSYFPKLISYSDNGYELEYFKWLDLGNLYVNFDVSREKSSIILYKLRDILDEFSNKKLDKINCDNIYLEKNFSRFWDFLDKKSSEYNDIFRTDFDIKVNGRTFQSINTVFSRCETKLKEISRSAIETFIHGDMCFSNILYDNIFNRILFIDPKGSFHKIGNTGDIRYDISKLSHSIFGLYDYIIYDRYEFKVGPTYNNFTLKFNKREHVSYFQDIFKEKILSCFNYEEIRLIEAWLFLSMLPLHEDSFERQLCFMLIGLGILDKLGI